jgi:hypothetical protein
VGARGGHRAISKTIQNFELHLATLDRVRWLEDVENYLGEPEVKLNRKENNTEEWTSVVKDAELLKGP